MNRTVSDATVGKGDTRMRRMASGSVTSVGLIAVAVLGVCLMIPGGSSVEASPGLPVVYWSSSPVEPGETVLLVGEGLDESVGVDVALSEWRRVESANADGKSLRFEIPRELGFGVYTVRLHSDKGSTDPILLNAPDPWWVICDAGDQATPSGWVRVVGNALSFDGKGMVRISSDSGAVYDLTPSHQNEYSIEADLPGAIAEGRWSVAVNNGLGGEGLWVEAGDIEVVEATTWSSDVINVVDFGADPSGLTNSTSAIRAALKAAKDRGGGVVFLPRGVYSVRDELVVPPHTIVKGEGKGLTSLDWASRRDPLPSLIRGTDHFVLEDLVIYHEGDHGDIIVGENHVTISGLRIRSTAYFMFNSSLEPRRGWMLPLTRAPWDMGDAIVVTGSDFRIVDNDVYVTRNAIRLEQASYGVISSNKLRSGLSPIEMCGAHHVIFEQNEATGASYYSTGMSIGLDDSSTSSHSVYVGGNRFDRFFAASSSDKATVGGNGTVYCGKVRESQGQRVTLATADAQSGMNDWQGMTLYVLSGKGAGQYRTVVGVHGCQLEIDNPFSVEPDATSVVSVGKFNGRHLFVGNEFTDMTVAVHLSAPGAGSIVASNTLERAGSIEALGFVSQDGSDVQPSWYNQFVDNRIVDGMTWGDGGLPVRSGLVVRGDSPGDCSFSVSMGQVIRSNALGYHGFVEVCGSVIAIVVENAAGN
jgi:hypothetical protein